MNGWYQTYFNSHCFSVDGKSSSKFHTCSLLSNQIKYYFQSNGSSLWKLTDSQGISWKETDIEEPRIPVFQALDAFNFDPNQTDSIK